MAELAKQNNTYITKGNSKSRSIKYFAEKGDEYKLDLLQGLEDGEITFYTQGDFTDLCRGPHIPATGFIKAIKLTNIAGAYWKGDEKNKQLTRIYGVTFPSQKQLDEYLQLLEEAKKRDHRKLGKELGIYTMDDDVGPGLDHCGCPMELLSLKNWKNWPKKQNRMQDINGWLLRISPKKACISPVDTCLITRIVCILPWNWKGEKYYLKSMNCPHHHKILCGRTK